jgi:hypothetical protein
MILVFVCEFVLCLLFSSACCRCCTGAKVIVLLDAATRAGSVPNMIANAPHSIHSTCVQNKAHLINLPDGLLWRGWVQQFKERYQVKVLETMDFICGSTLCPCVIADRMMYWDSNHLTWQALNYLFRPIVAQLLALDFLPLPPSIPSATVDFKAELVALKASANRVFLQNQAEMEQFAREVVSVPPNLTPPLMGLHDYVNAQQKNFTECVVDGAPVGGGMDNRCDMGDLTSKTLLYLIGACVVCVH